MEPQPAEQHEDMEIGTAAGYGSPYEAIPFSYNFIYYGAPYYQWSFIFGFISLKIIRFAHD